MSTPVLRHDALASLEKASRWSSIITSVGAIVFIAALIYAVTHLSRDTKKIDAQQKLIQLSSTLGNLRPEYQTGSNPTDVNERSRHLIAEMLTVSDKDLNICLQIFKHESLAYAWGMVAGSEPYTEKDLQKMEAIRELLKECDITNELIAKVIGSNDAKLEATRSWILQDDTLSRIQRLTAVGLCIRSTLSHSRIDARNAGEIIKNLPENYVAREHPERSLELQPCLVGSEKDDQ